MKQASGPDPDHGNHAATTSELDAAPDDIGRVRSSRNIEQQAGDDEEPEFVDAKHDLPNLSQQRCSDVSCNDKRTNLQWQTGLCAGGRQAGRGNGDDLSETGSGGPQQ